jgi:N-acetyl-gamma-glutamyl-phosphate reductase
LIKPTIAFCRTGLDVNDTSKGLTDAPCIIMHSCVNTIPVGVLGASGYAGRELCALLMQHPRFKLAFATANNQRGETLAVGQRHIQFIDGESADLSSAAVIFSALPHGASAEWVSRSAKAGARVVDLSSDLRPGSGADAGVPYGMPELDRTGISTAAIVANPGCYPTAILLAVAPLIRAGLIAPNGQIIANAASGVTGAGNSPRRDMLFAEVAGDYRAYGIGNHHRHVPEMKATVSALGGSNSLLFTPHLLPVARGILATVTVPLTQPLADPLEPFQKAYGNEPLIEVVSEPPALKDVVNRGVARISAVSPIGMEQPTLLVFSAIDNLLKGAASQALQNANIMFGLDETMGIPS